MSKIMSLNIYKSSVVLLLFVGPMGCSKTTFTPEAALPSIVSDQTLESKEKNFDINTNNKSDILIITDNSSSMRDEQANMAQRMSHFLDQIKDLDWRIAVTTTDPENVIGGDGQLLPLTGLSKSFFYSSLHDPNLAQKIIGDTIQRKETGSPEEQGISATYRMLERARAGQSPNKDFIRDDANFIAIVISDEDETGHGVKNSPLGLTKYIKDQWSTKKFVFHSIISKPGDHDCEQRGHTPGNSYAALSAMTGLGDAGGAVIGSVCADDYGTQLKGMGKSILDMFLSLELDCEPIGGESNSVIVIFNNSNYAEKYKVKGRQIIFERPLPRGKYSLKYECKKNK